MAKKSPQLQVVGSEVKVQPYDIVALDQLSDNERERLQAAIADIEDGAGTLGVMRGVRPWDLRPVLMIFGESGPSMVRLVGPEVAHSKQTTEALSAHFKRQQNVPANVLEWGTYQGQIWYRRPLFDRTLDAVLDSKLLPSAKDAFGIAEQLVKILTQWHHQGVVHGHLCPANIAISMENKASLFDAGVAYAIVRATRELGFEDFPQGYERGTFAPEILAQGSISYSTDIFGFGYVLEKLFSKVSASVGESGEEITEADIEAVLQFAQLMQSAELHNRPQLAQVQQFIINRGRPESVMPIQEISKEKIKLTAKVSAEDDVSKAEQQSTKEAAALGLEEAAELSKKKELAAQLLRESLEKEELEARRLAELVEKASRQEQLEREQFAADQLKRAALDSYSSSIPHERLQPASSLEISQPKKLPSWALYVFTLVALVGIIYQAGLFQSSKQEVSLITDNDLVTNWNSSLPSRMSLVAQAAIHPEFPNERARSLMLQSAMQAEDLTNFNGALLRVAFSPEWEVELSEADRRVAYALSAVELLHKDMPTDLPQLNSLHPGLIFAVTATGGKNVASILSQIPAARLTELPSPYRQAFKVLIKESPEVTSGSVEVMELARFAAYGVRDTARLVTFLEADKGDFPRIRALAYLLSQDPVRARELLTVLVGNANTAHAVNHPLVNWAKEWQLYNWSELDSTDQLLLLAGVPVQTPIAGQNTHKLLLHPVIAVRLIGIEHLIALGRLPHPGGLSALDWVRNNPEKLTPKQTFTLVQIIFHYRSAKISAFKEWLASNPPQELVQSLLVGSSAVSEELTLDFELLQHLKERGWTPSGVELRQLIKHPSRAVRIYAYHKLFTEVDKETAVALLLEARKHETLPEFIEQIERNIAVLSKE